MRPLLVTVLVGAGSAAAIYIALRLHHPRTEPGPAAGAANRGGGSLSAPSVAASVAAALVSLVMVGVVLGDVAIGVERETAAVRWDEQVAHWASANAGVFGAEVLRGVTHLGDTVVVLGVAVAFGLVLLKAGRRRAVVFVVTVVVGQWVLSNLIKELVARARPNLDPLAAFSGYSFPSGHATAASATYLALALVLVAVQPRWSVPLVVATSVGLAVAVATSRVMLGVHWFSDVLGGLALGWTWCLVCAWLLPVTRSETQPASARFQGLQTG